jgi:hypothetical protein
MDPVNETILLMGKLAFFVIVGFCATTAIVTAVVLFLLNRVCARALTA